MDFDSGFSFFTYLIDLLVVRGFTSTGSSASAVANQPIGG